MYLFQCDIMLFLFIIFAMKDHYLFPCVTIDCIYVQQTVKPIQ